MSVQEEINRIKDNISDAYDSVEAKGGTIPTTLNSANLPNAINSIDTGIKDVKVNGTSVVTDEIANVTVPTKTSELTNDSAFVNALNVASLITTHNTSTTAHDDIRDEIDGKQPLITSSNKLPYSYLSGTPTIPSKTSQLTNDSGFLTSHQAVVNNAPTLVWSTTSTIGSVGGTALQVKMPANPNTTYSAGTGLSLSGTKFNHSNSITAGSIGSWSTVPILTYDAQGHITATDYDRIYPPTTAGNSGQVWTSKGSGVGQWASPSIEIVQLLSGNKTANFTITNVSGYKLYIVGASINAYLHWVTIPHMVLPSASGTKNLMFNDESNYTGWNMYYSGTTLGFTLGSNNQNQGIRYVYGVK